MKVPTSGPNPLSRRDLFQRVGLGVGSIALGSLLAEDLAAAPRKPADPLAPKASHFFPKAKRVIFLHMVGGALAP